MQLSPEARQLLGVFFPFSQKDGLISREPHSQIGRVRVAYNECIAKGLLVETPYDEFGSVQICATDAGFRVAREQASDRMRSLAALMNPHEKTDD